MKKVLIALTTIALSTASMGMGTAMAAGSQTTGAPGVIASAGMGSCDALPDATHKWNTTPLADKLTKDGVDFSSISTFGNCFKVAALDANGNTTVQLYEPDTLNRVM